MRHLFATSAIAMLAALPVSAQNIAADFAAEVRATASERHDRYSVYPASAEMVQLIGRAVGDDHASVWGGWMGNAYIEYDEFYTSAMRNLDAWNSAIHRGDVDPETAEAILVPAMDRFRDLDDRVVYQVSEAYFFVRVRASHFAAAIALDHSEDHCGEYERLMQQAAQAWQHAYAALPSELQYAVPIPPLEGYGDAEEAVRAALPAADAPLSDYPDRLAVMALLLERYGIASDDPTLLAFDALATHAGSQRFADQAVVLLQRQAEAGEGHMHHAAQAQVALLERAATVLPDVVASLASLDRPLTAEDIRPLYDFAVRAEQLQADADNPISMPSNLARSLAGLRGTISALEIAEGDANAHQYVSVVTDFSTAASSQVPVTAAFAVPAGVFGGHLNWQVEGMGSISDTLGALSVAIRTGNPNDLQRALDLSQQVRSTLHPGRIAHHWVHGAASGLASNVPFGRAILGELLETLGPMEEQDPEGDTDDASALCP